MPVLLYFLKAISKAKQISRLFWVFPAAAGSAEVVLMLKTCGFNCDADENITIFLCEWINVVFVGIIRKQRGHYSPAT